MLAVQGLLLAVMGTTVQEDTHVSPGIDASDLWVDAAKHLPEDFQVAVSHRGNLSLQGQGVRSGYSLWYDQDILGDEAVSVLAKSERLEFELDESMDATDREREHQRLVGLATSRCHAFEEALRRGQRKVNLAVWVDREGPARLRDMVEHGAPYVFTATHFCYADCEAAAALAGVDVDSECGILRSMPVSCKKVPSVKDTWVLDRAEATIVIIASTHGELNQVIEAAAGQENADLGLDYPSVNRTTAVVRRGRQRSFMSSLATMAVQAVVHTTILSAVVLMFAVCKPDAKIALGGLFEAVVMAQTFEAMADTAALRSLRYLLDYVRTAGTMTPFIATLSLTWDFAGGFFGAFPDVVLIVARAVIPLAVIEFHATALAERKRLVALPPPAAPQNAASEEAAPAPTAGPRVSLQDLDQLIEKNLSRFAHDDSESS